MDWQTMAAHKSGRDQEAMGTSWIPLASLGTDPVPSQVPNLLETFNMSIVDMDYVVGRLNWLLSLATAGIEAEMTRLRLLPPEMRGVRHSTNVFNKQNTSIHVHRTCNGSTNVADDPLRDGGNYTFNQSNLTIPLETNQEKLLRLKRALAAYKQTTSIIMSYTPYFPRIDFNQDVECSQSGKLVNNCPDFKLPGETSQPTVIGALSGALEMAYTFGDNSLANLLQPGIVGLDHSFLEKEYLGLLLSTIPRLLDPIIIWQLFWRVYLHLTIASLPYLGGNIQAFLTVPMQLAISRDIFRTRFSFKEDPLNQADHQDTVPDTNSVPLDTVLSLLTVSRGVLRDCSGKCGGSVKRKYLKTKNSQTTGHEDSPLNVKKSLRSDPGEPDLTRPPTDLPPGLLSNGCNYQSPNHSVEALRLYVDREDAMTTLPIVSLIVGNVERSQEYCNKFPTKTPGELERKLKLFRSRDRASELYKFLLRFGDNKECNLRQVVEQFSELMVGPDVPPGERDQTQKGRRDIAWYVSAAYHVGQDYIPLPTIINGEICLTDRPLNKPPITIVTKMGHDKNGSAKHETEFGNILTLQTLMFLFRITLSQIDDRKCKYGPYGTCRVPRDEALNFAAVQQSLSDLVAVEERVVKSVRTLLAMSATIPYSSYNSDRGQYLGMPSIEICRTLFLSHSDDIEWFSQTLIVDSRLKRIIEMRSIDGKDVGLKSDDKEPSTMCDLNHETPKISHAKSPLTPNDCSISSEGMEVD